VHAKREEAASAEASVETGGVECFGDSHHNLETRPGKIAWRFEVMVTVTETASVGGG
jgi:hypothetical protein